MNWYRRKFGPLVYAPEVKAEVYISNGWRFRRLGRGFYLGLPAHQKTRTLIRRTNRKTHHA